MKFVCKLDCKGLCFKCGKNLNFQQCQCLKNNTKIKNFVPGFQATIPFYEGIRKTLAWFDAEENRKWVNPNVNHEMDRIIAAHE